MNNNTIRAAANRALILVNPQYHSWSTERQEQYRATMDAAALSRLEVALLKDLANIHCEKESVDSFWSHAPLPLRNTLNWAKLLATGIGKDWIVLNEFMPDGTSLLEFETLYDYDFDDHLFQEADRREQQAGYPGSAYYAFRCFQWARLIIGGQLYYASLYSLANYICEVLEESGGQIIDTLIPHQMVEGENHGKEEDRGICWDYRLDANGLEGQLRELTHRWHLYLEQRWRELSVDFEQTSPAVYVEDESTPDGNHRNFIFNNAEALKRIRWKHFLADCEGIESDMELVEKRLGVEKAAVEEWLNKTHADVMENFDPTMVKMEERRKIIIAPGALDELEDGDE